MSTFHGIALSIECCISGQLEHQSLGWPSSKLLAKMVTDNDEVYPLGFHKKIGTPKNTLLHVKISPRTHSFTRISLKFNGHNRIYLLDVVLSRLYPRYFRNCASQPPDLTENARLRYGNFLIGQANQRKRMNVSEQVWAVVRAVVVYRRLFIWSQWGALPSVCIRLAGKWCFSCCASPGRRRMFRQPISKFPLLNRIFTGG